MEGCILVFAEDLEELVAVEAQIYEISARIDIDRFGRVRHGDCEPAEASL
jgi:hypothetical protein